MIAAVLLDLDGTLVDSYEVWFQVVNDVADQLDAPGISRELFASCWGQGVEADIERFYPGMTPEALEARYEEAFPGHLEHMQVDAGAAPLLARLRERGLRTAVITNTPGELAREILGHAGLTVDAVVGGGDVPSPKPAGDMVLRACRLLGVDPGAAVVLGDTDYDRAAARAAGVRFVGLRIRGDHRIEALPDLFPLLDSGTVLE